MAIIDETVYGLKGKQVKDVASRVKDNADDIAGLETTVAGKQDALTQTQLDAVDSGITSQAVQKLASIPANAEANTIDSISVNGTAVTPDANKNVNLTIVDALTSVATGQPLSANQGRVLNSKIEGLITMTDTDPGEGAPLEAGKFIAVYDGSNS